MSKQVFDINKFLPDLRVGATVADLAAKHGLNKRSVHRYLAALERHGYTLHKIGLSRWAIYKLMDESK